MKYKLKFTIPYTIFHNFQIKNIKISFGIKTASHKHCP